MLFTLGIGSNIGMASVIITVLRDEFPKLKQWWLAIGAAVFGIGVGSIFCTPAGQFLLNLVDFYGVSNVVFFLAVAELIAIAWIYGVKQICQDIEFMSKRKTGWYWRITWQIVTPIFMIVILIYTIVDMKLVKYRDYDYPKLVHGKNSILFKMSVHFNCFYFSQELDGFYLVLV